MATTILEESQRTFLSKVTQGPEHSL